MIASYLQLGTKNGRVGERMLYTDSKGYELDKHWHKVLNVIIICAWYTQLTAEKNQKLLAVNTPYINSEREDA